MAKRLLLLNGVAIVCVILFHATGFGFTAMFAWAHRYRPVSSPNFDAVGTGAYYAFRLIEQFVVFAIPAFLFVSGFFVSVLTGRAGSVNRKAIWARIRALLVPYFIWSAVLLTGMALQGRTFGGGQYVRMLLTGSTDPSYYYVPLLVQLYLLAPVIVLLARWRWKLLIGVTAAIQVGMYLLQYAIVLDVRDPGIRALAAALPKWLFVAHVFWFSAGVVAGFQHSAIKAALEPRRWMLLPALVTLFLIGFVEWELLLKWSGVPWRENRATLIDGLYAGTMILSFLVAQDLRLPKPDTLVWLGSQSFGIYLVHGVVMEYFSRGLYHAAPWILGQQWLFQPLLIALGLSVPLTLMWVVRRSPSRGLYSYVFG